MCQLGEGAEVSSALAAVLTAAGDETVVSGASGVAGADVEAAVVSEGVDAGAGAVVVGLTSGVFVAAGDMDIDDVALADGEEVAEVETLALGDALFLSDGFGEAEGRPLLSTIVASERSCRVGLSLGDG